MFKRLLFLFTPIIVTTVLSAQTSELNMFGFCGYTGGMMVHSGYLCSNVFSIYNKNGILLGEQQIKNAPFGIGGIIRFHFGTEKNQLRIGVEGYTSTVKYYPVNSYEKMGWGGILLDYKHNGKNCVNPFVGATLGGGGLKNHTYLEVTGNDYIIEEYASFRKYSFFCISPFAGLEIAVSKKMLLIFKGDYLINISNRQNDFAEGIRIYAGIIFNRSD